MGFQVESLSFSWKVEEAGSAKKMQSARIRIFQGEEQIYDSGEDENANSTDYQVKMELQPRTRYTWSVEVTADNGESAKAESYFETGKMKESWTAKWIAPQIEDEDIHPIMWKTFEAGLEDVNKSARLYMCGLGVYEVYINGKRSEKSIWRRDIIHMIFIYKCRRMM